MTNSLLGLSPKQKKKIVNNQIANGSTQGYNSLMADLELGAWNERHNPKNALANIIKEAGLLTN